MSLFMPGILSIIVIYPLQRCKKWPFPWKCQTDSFRETAVASKARGLCFHSFEEFAIAITGKVLSKEEGSARCLQGRLTLQRSMGVATALLCSSCQNAFWMLISFDSETFTVLVYILKWGFSFCWKFACWQLWNVNFSLSFQIKCSITDRNFPHSLKFIFCKCWG